MEEKKISKECLYQMEVIITEIMNAATQGERNLALDYTNRYKGYILCLYQTGYIDYSTYNSMFEDINTYYNSFFKFQKQESGVLV